MASHEYRRSTVNDGELNCRNCGITIAVGDPTRGKCPGPKVHIATKDWDADDSMSPDKMLCGFEISYTPEGDPRGDFAIEQAGHDYYLYDTGPGDKANCAQCLEIWNKENP